MLTLHNKVSEVTHFFWKKNQSSGFSEGIR